MKQVESMHRMETETADLAGVPEAPERPVILALKDVSIAYEDAEPIIQEATLSVHEGESVLFLGPSGCGKSTLAMLCAGLIPRAVEATLKGQVWRQPRLVESGRIGYVFQDADAQFCMLKVADEIAFGLENLQVDPADMPGRITRGLQQAGLDVSLDAHHTEFSGGMKQKLAIACALAMETDLLVFDEPTANLDPLSTHQVFEQIAALHRQGRSLIVIEHKFDALLPQMDKVVLFTPDGRIHRTGEVRKVVYEEWNWLISVGVIPQWKAMPGWLEEPAEGHLLSISGQAVKHSSDERERVEPVAEQGESTLERLNVMADPMDMKAPLALEIHAGELVYQSRLGTGKNKVWSDLSVQIPAGSLTAVVGPNGAGKSSLLQVFAGMRKMTRGEATLFGKPISSWKRQELARVVSYCFQNPELQFIYERVADELANRMVGTMVPAEIKSLLQEFGLAGLEQHSPFALSQGQKRRLSVAAMVRDEHELYLLDEPTFGQDAATQHAIMQRLGVLREAGKTIVMTTHDMDLVRRYADRVVVIADGKLLFAGDPNGLFRQPLVMQQAHLQDDLRQVGGSVSKCEEEGDPPPGLRDFQGRQEGPSPPEESGARENRNIPRPGSKTLAERLNPPWFMVTSILAMLVAIFANTLPQALAMFALPVLLLLILRRLGPWQVIKRLSPFLLFYVLYIWSLTAYGAVPPGTPAIHILWMHLSWVGFHSGLVLAFRMLGAVAFGVLFVSSVEITDLIVGLSQNFRIPPKFSYGMLAGIRFAPLFQSEWSKLKQARQLRGKDARYPIFRPVMYSLPLLSQAIRMSERVATAMEARGFFAAAAATAKARTYFRTVVVKGHDFVFLFLVVGLTVALLVVLS